MNSNTHVQSDSSAHRASVVSQSPCSLAELEVETELSENVSLGENMVWGLRASVYVSTMRQLPEACRWSGRQQSIGNPWRHDCEADIVQ